MNRAPRRFLYVIMAASATVSAVLAQTPTIRTVAGGGPNGVPALQTAVNPAAVAVDSQGNLFIGDDGRVYKIDPAGQLTTYAGGGPTQVAGGIFVIPVGDGGPATNATFLAVSGLVLDGQDNLYISDSGTHRVRKVNRATGIITTVAGTGSFAFNGDGGAATAASLNQPADITLDGVGNLLIADRFNHRVRRVNATTGVIMTVAGTGSSASSGDGGPATAAGVGQPTGIALDGNGNLFISQLAGRVRRVDSMTGIITTFAGTGFNGFNGDGIPAQNAQLNAPRRVELDGLGNLLIADTQNGRIRRVDAGSGMIATVAGDGSASYTGDGVLATTTGLNLPEGVALSGAGDILIADAQNRRVRSVDAATGIITTIAGNGTGSFTEDGFPAVNSIVQPAGIAVDPAGNMFICDPTNRRLRRVDASTRVMTTVAGNGEPGFSGDEGPAEEAALTPAGLVLDPAGNIYVADVGSHRVRRIDAMTGIITTMAGNGTQGFSGDNGPGASASLNNPVALAFDVFGTTLLIADRDNFRVRGLLVDQGGVIFTYAGNGLAAFQLDDGSSATLASLGRVTGLGQDATSNVLIATPDHHRIRKVNPFTRGIGTFSGTALFGFCGDGGRAEFACLNSPMGVARDPAGNVFIADTGNNRIRQVTRSLIISTVAGNGIRGYAGDGGPATSARLNRPSAVAIDPGGNSLISDTDNRRVRRVALFNQPPLADAGPDQQMECSGPAGAMIHLDGALSSDPDSVPGTNSDIASFDWFENRGLPSETFLGSGETLDVTLSLGFHTITLVVTDLAGDADADTVTVTVEDTQPPDILVLPPAVSLWPPNHRMVDFAADVTGSDLCGSVSFALVSATSSEPDDAPGGGDGNTSDDIQGAEIGTPDFGLALRAERDGSGTGRTYEITFAGTDSSGNVATSTVSLFVPHDQGGGVEPLAVSVQENNRGTILEWAPVPGALFYNAIRGELRNLHETANTIDLGPVVCLDSHSQNATTWSKEDAGIPPEGEAFFYLVEYDEGWASGYGTESVGKPRVPGPGYCE